MHPKDRLIFALDVPTRADAVRYAQLLDGHVGCFKVGLQLFISEGPEVVRAIREHSGVDIFLDLKLHDIPATVRSAVKSAVRHDVQYLTVHCGSGMEMLRAAVEGAQGSALKLLGVTVLTSTGAAEVSAADPSFKEMQLANLVLERARLAQSAGVHGVVCSGQEVAHVKNAVHNEIIAVVPGIRPEWSLVSGDDQSRITTPAQAVQQGADMIVVGRPIRDADDPKVAAQRIADEIASVKSTAG